MERTGTQVHQVAQAVEEQLKEDEQELKTREKKKQSTGAKRIRGVVHENNKNKGRSHLQGEMEKLMHRDEQVLSL